MTGGLSHIVEYAILAYQASNLSIVSWMFGLSFCDRYCEMFPGPEEGTTVVVKDPVCWNRLFEVRSFILQAGLFGVPDRSVSQCGAMSSHTISAVKTSSSPGRNFGQRKGVRIAHTFRRLF